MRIGTIKKKMHSKNNPRTFVLYQSVTAPAAKVSSNEYKQMYHLSIHTIHWIYSTIKQQYNDNRLGIFSKTFKTLNKKKKKRRITNGRPDNKKENVG